MSDEEERRLIAAAVAARENAYAPYSRFCVGAAVRLRDGRTFAGANVENASYPLSVCAERNAVAAAVLAGAKPGDLVAVAVAAHGETPTPPCGACRQVLSEFAGPGVSVVIYNVADGSSETATIAELLPFSFAPNQLPVP
jgi:homotetrameric cytidine deaminase